MFIKRILSILLVLFMLGGTMFLGGCFRNKYTKIKEDSVGDGLFKYYLETQKGDVDYYAITGSNQDPCPETLYFPAYYKGKEVKYPFYSDMTFANNLFGHNLNGAKTVYFAYNSILTYGERFGKKNFNTFPECFFFINNSDNGAFSSFCKYFSYKDGEPRKFFYTSIKFKSFVGVDAIYKSDYKIILKYNDNTCVSQIANTSFLFNYLGSPNDGYFFINDFTRGGLIENTPYEPQRKGYTFGGWYKEAECLNVWNFETDMTPATLYDENGKEVYQETKLYAKWTKNKK